MIDDSASRGASGVPMLTAMTTSAPIWRTTSIGRLSTRPPSPRIRPRTSTGEKMPGTDMLARIASYNGPSVKTYGTPATMSVATARNGIGSLSRSRMPSALAVSSCRKSSRFAPLNAPWKPRTSPSRKPISSGSGKRKSICLSRKSSSRRGGESENSVFQLSVVTIVCISAGARPLEYKPPTIEPIDVAAM